MEWIEITRYVAICIYAIAAVVVAKEWKKKSPQDYPNKRLLGIEVWMLLLLAISLINKISIAIVM